MDTVDREVYCMSLDSSCNGESNDTLLEAQLPAVEKFDCDHKGTVAEFGGTVELNG